MIVNHQYKFIFIRTRKVASTSVEIALSKYCDSNDIITRMGRGDGWEIRQELGYQHHCNWAGFEAHDSAQKVHKRLPDIWDDYFKFSIIRDPFEYLISDYYWKNRNNETKTFEEFVDESIRKKENNWYIHTINDKPAMDYYARYENLTEDLNTVSKKLGLPGLLGDEVVQIHEKSEHRKNRSPDISEKLKNKIQEAYRNEIDLFNKLRSQ